MSWASQKCLHVLIPRNYYCYLIGKRNFANVIKGCKVKRFILNWPGGPNINHISPQKRDTGRISTEDNMLTEAETGIMSFEDGGRGHKPRNIGHNISWKRQGNRSSSGASRSQQCPHLDFNSVKFISDIWPPELLENKLVFVVHH